MNYYRLILSLSLVAMLTACDYNERNFPGLDELSRPEHIIKEELSVTEANLPAVVAALNASDIPEASLWTAALNRDKAFSSEAPAESILPHYLRSLYYGADAGSLVDVTYDRITVDEDTPATERVTVQFFLTTAGWIFDPTIVRTFTKENYQVLVDYVLRTHAAANPALVNAPYHNAEYWYGFSAYYGNVTYREIDRAKDTAYPKTGTVEEKAAFMNTRTVEGLAVWLTETMPDLGPEVNGIEQRAKITVLIYADPLSDRQNVNWTYTFRCTAPGKWEFVERTSDDGKTEAAP
jgi:hypothetical protein